MKPICPRAEEPHLEWKNPSRGNDAHKIASMGESNMKTQGKSNLCMSGNCNDIPEMSGY